MADISVQIELHYFSVTPCVNLLYGVYVLENKKVLSTKSNGMVIFKAYLESKVLRMKQEPYR